MKISENAHISLTVDADLEDIEYYGDRCVKSIDAKTLTVGESPLTEPSISEDIPNRLHSFSDGRTSGQLLNEQIYSKKMYWKWKRVQDVFLSAVALVTLFPLMLLIALVIYIDDPHGNPIFTQVRIGKNGKPFKFYKFRSMCVDAESKLEELLKDNEMDGPTFKIKNDPRITRVGRFIRKTSLDELPQLWNILKGDMSIVGPRPALPREVKQYDEYQRERLLVKPGLTCYWQIQPHRNDISFDRWVNLDIKYIQECGFLTDWKIIFRTVGAVLSMQGV